MTKRDTYSDIKRGIISDIAGLATNLAGAFGFFTFALFLLMLLWAVIAKNSTADAEVRLICLALLCVLLPCLFVRRLGNMIFTAWCVLLIGSVALAIIAVLLYIVYVCFGVGFGYI